MSDLGPWLTSLGIVIMILIGLKYVISWIAQKLALWIVIRQYRRR